MRARFFLFVILSSAALCAGCDEDGNFTLFDTDAGDTAVVPDDAGTNSDATTDDDLGADAAVIEDTSAGPAVCGDGAISGAETCEEGQVPSCTEAGFEHGQTFCVDCELITSTCWNGSAASGEINEQEILARHNIARMQVNPAAASPMPLLTWDEELAEFARGYTANCVWEHSDSPWGENLYAGTSGNGLSASAVDGWVSEVDDYDYASNSCSNVCGHYTQVVWADSLRVGCGVTYCPNPSGLPWAGYILSCNYDPPGNFRGQRPYETQ